MTRFKAIHIELMQYQHHYLTKHIKPVIHWAILHHLTGGKNYFDKNDYLHSINHSAVKEESKCKIF